MKIGYASLTYGVKETALRTCTAKNATPDYLRELIGHNLSALEKMIEYNQKNGILMFRLSSSLIPFASSPINSLEWRDEFQKELQRIGEKIRAAGIRISMHPGQYTVLNSPKEEVVEKATEDLVYHAGLLGSLGAKREGKIILHVGGVYGDKEAAMIRFAENFQTLPTAVKERLVIENDDVSYTIAEVLRLSALTRSPVVYDNLHDRLNPADPDKNDAHWIREAGKTWTEEDGRQKIHYSQQHDTRRVGGHSRTIHLEEFQAFYRRLPYEVDIMLEVKDKNLSALKVLHFIQPECGITGLEKEWSRYKYAVLEHSPALYNEIRFLLKDKGGYPVVAFYRLIDRALAEEKTKGRTRNVFDHVWGYFKGKATEKEQKTYESYLARFEKGTLSDSAVKNLLFKLAEKYRQEYLLHSYFFYM